MNISPESEDTLAELSIALDLYEGEFKLILARCNYRYLRDRLIARLQEIHPQPIHEIKLPRSLKDVYTYVIGQIPVPPPWAVSISGLDEIADLHAALLDLNINRETFRNNCPYPIVWWISDRTHRQIIRTAPDFESWTTTLEFAIATDELLTSLEDGSETLFAHVLAPSEIPFFKKLNQIETLGTIQTTELENALKDLGDRGLNIEPKLWANINFIRGLDSLPPNNSPEKALQYLQASCDYWQQVGDWERSGLLLNQIGQLNYQITDVEKHRLPNWEVARSAFQAAMDHFEKANRRDLSANVILRLVVIAKRMNDWVTIEQLIQRALPLHQEFHNPHSLSLDYRYLAEIAIQRQQWQSAKTHIELALSFLAQVPTVAQEWRNLYLLMLAQAEVKLGNDRDGLQILLEAQALGDTGHPQVCISILQELRSLYTRQKQYLEAFITKQEQYAIEQQYGYRAFIGAGRLQGKKSEGKSQTDVATEIEASGRKLDLDELITRIAKPSYKMIVLYGKSGVGKSSLVNAGLIPKLEHISFEGKDVQAIALRVYTNWEEELAKTLASAQGRSPLPPLQRGALDDLNNQVPLDAEGRGIEPMLVDEMSAQQGRSPLPPLQRGALDNLNNQVPLFKGDAEGRGIEPMLVDEMSAQGEGLKLDSIISKLREKEAQNKRLVLIFDQFEEFFFVYYNQPTERRRFFEFIGKLLNDSQNLSSLKVILSLREDYIHYLLECNQIESMAAIDQDILSKNVLYRVGNLNLTAARSLIQTLTEKSRFYLEPELIEAIADDLKDELGEVRPIELQVVGAQLQQEGIKTLTKYRQLGDNPKSVLVERYLNDVIVDCGAENQRLAKFILFLLTDEKGTRPLRTREELERGLQDLLTDRLALDLVLEIAVRSGLVVLIPESPLDRYQLVHDYLAEFIRASQAPEMAKLQQELAETKEELGETVQMMRHALKKEEDAKIKAKKRSRLAVGVGIVASVMAIAAGVAGFFALRSSDEAWKSKLNEEFVSANYKIKSLINSDRQLDALVEAVETAEKLQKSLIASPDVKMRLITSMQEIVYSIKEKNRLVGHNVAIRNVAFSPDGKKLASASWDKTIKIWSVDGKELQTLKGHTSDVYSVAFSPDGKYLASGSRDNTIRIWSIDGRELQILKGHTQPVNSVVFSPNGKQLATASGDSTVKLWSIDGKGLQTFKGHSNSIFGIAFSPDGQKLVSASYDKTVKIWSIDGKELQTLKGHNSPVLSVAFSPDGKQIASSSRDNTAKIWSIDGKELQTLKGHTYVVRSVTFSPDGKQLATASYDGTIRIWSIDGKELQTLRGHSVGVINAVFSPDGKQLASSSDDATVKIWNVDGKDIATFKGHTDIVRSIAFSPDGKQLASASFDKTIKIWSTDGKELKTLKGHTDLVRSIAFLPDGKQLASASSDKTIKIWSTDGKELKTLKGHTDIVRSIAFSPDGKQLASASNDKTIKIWSMDGKELQTLKGHTDEVLSVAFSPDGKQLASASSDKSVKIWSIDGKELQTLKGHTNIIYSIVFSPDGKYLASASRDSTIKIWSMDGKELQTLKGHHSAVTSVVFSPDSKQLASASSDKTAKIWSMDGKELQTFKGHTNEVLSITFSPDGKQLATASRDNTIKIWNLDLDGLKGLACYWMQDYINTQPDLQRRLATCLDAETLKAASPYLMADARTKGMNGKPEEALLLFQEAQKLDRNISLDPQSEIKSYLIPKGERLAKEGNIKAALVAYDKAIKSNPNIKISAVSWTTLCWNGILNSSASQVIFACDNAVNLDPDNADMFVNRGKARALGNNTNGAIADFEILLSQIYRDNLETWLSIRSRKYDLDYPMYQNWIDNLKQDKNPFTEEKLEEWRQEEKSIS